MNKETTDFTFINTETGEMTSGTAEQEMATLFGENCNGLCVSLNDGREDFLFNAYDACKILKLLDSDGDHHEVLGTIPEESRHLIKYREPNSNQELSTWFVNEEGLSLLILQSPTKMGDEVRVLAKKIAD